MAKTKNKKVFARNSGFFSDESAAKTTKKGFRQGIRIISAVYCCISVIEKRKKVAGRMTIKGHGPGRMPWRAASGPRAVGCQPLMSAKSCRTDKDTFLLQTTAFPNLAFFMRRKFLNSGTKHQSQRKKSSFPWRVQTIVTS